MHAGLAMIKKYDNITCAALTRVDLSQLGVQFFRLIQSFQFSAPTHVGTCEPINEIYRSESAALAYWGNPLLWRNTKTKTRGSVWMGEDSLHSCVYVQVRPVSGRLDSDELLRFLGELGALLGADFGYIHYTTEVEWSHPESTYESVYAVDVGVTTHDLRLGIPNVCWAMLLGQPYIEVASCFPSDPLAEYIRREVSGNVIVQADVSLFSLRTEFERFLLVRQRMQERMSIGCIGNKKRPALWRPTFAFR